MRLCIGTKGCCILQWNVAVLEGHNYKCTKVRLTNHPLQQYQHELVAVVWRDQCIFKLKCQSILTNFWLRSLLNTSLLKHVYLTGFIAMVVPCIGTLLLITKQFNILLVILLYYFLMNNYIRYCFTVGKSVFSQNT